MLFYMRYIRAKNEIEDLKKENQKLSRDHLREKDDKDIYFKRNVKLAR